LQERAAVCGVEPNIIVDGLIALHIRPDGTVSVRVTVPVNPASAVSVMVEVAWMFRGADAGLATRLKSVIVNVTLVLWTRLPLVPVTVTL
jgi:hypothetical protein